MPRNITVTFDDGTTHVYQNAPDNVTPDQVSQRAQQDFGKSVTALDGGRAAPSRPNMARLTRGGASSALATGEAELAKRTAGMDPKVAEDARRRFYADPRISRLRTTMQGDDPPAPRPTLAQSMGQSAKMVLGNMAQGITSVFDPIAEAGEGVTNVVGSMIGAGGDAVLRAGGANQSTLDKWSKFWAPGDTPKIGEEIARITPKAAAPGAGVAAQMLGGMMVPLPGAKVKPTLKLPQAMAKQVAPTAAQEVIQEGEKAGIRVLTSDVKPPRTFIGKNVQTIGERIPFVGTGGTRAAQQTERVEAVKNVLREFGGDDTARLFDSSPTAVDDVAKSLSVKRSNDLSRLSTQKNAVIDGIDGVVPVDRTTTAIDQQIAKLEALNLDDVKPVIAKLKGWRTAIQNQGLRNVEEIRKAMGKAFDDPGLAGVKDTGQKALNAIYDPMRADMGTFIKNRGGAEKFAAWSSANQRLAAMAGELGNSALRNVLKSSEMTPENVGRLLFSKNRSDVARLYANLDAAGKSRAQAAVLQRAFDKAISADSGLSVERFVNNIRGLGDSVGVVFTGPDKARIEGLTRVLDATRRASGAALSPPTGVQNAPIAGGFAMGTLFGNAAIPIGALGGLVARAYESAPVRNALLKVGKTAPGSAAERIALRNVSQLLAKMSVGPTKALAPVANEQVPVAALAGETPEDQQ